MLNKLVQDVALSAYAVLANTGVLKVPAVRNIFLALYKFYKFNFEAGPIGSLQELIRPGDLVFDIGANIGVFTLCFARWVGPSGLVVAIEPEELNFKTLQSEIRRGGVSDRVDAINAICVDAPGERRLARNDVHPGDHKLSLDTNGDVVQAVSVDQLARERPGRKVSLLKIDVQGAETMVLRGAFETLGAHAPALFVEIQEEGLVHFGSSSAELIGILTDLGYTLNRLEAGGKIARQTESELAAAMKAKGYVDVLFLRAQR